MSWGLFCQIEVILLTLGLVIAFIIHSNQSAKDNSFFKRINALGKTLSVVAKVIPDKININKKEEE